MKVETFEHKQVSADGSDIDEFELFRRVKESNLEGQEKLFVESEGGITSFPFSLMSDAEMGVYEMVLPIKTPVEEFREELIPLRVIDIYDKFNELFSDVKIWTREKQAIDDPIMVGRVKSWDDDLEHDAPGGYYLLARWGKELIPFEEIKAAAIQQRKSEILSQIEPIRQMLKAKEEAVKKIDHWDPDILSPIKHRNLNIWS